MSNMDKDLDSLSPATALRQDTDRRGFMKVALGTGFAAAAMPVMAQNAIRTDAAGLTVGEVMVKVNGYNVPVYRAQPAGKTGLPVVLVISEIFGVHEYIADVARRFARQGYLALAPELFARQGDPTSYGTMAELLREVISKVPDEQVMADLDGVMAWARDNGGNTKKAGITGFCWGGRITWLYCGHNPQMKAGVSWYGRVVGDKTALTPRQPVDIAAGLKVPVLGLYGGKDSGIPLASVEQMKAALAQGSSGSQFVVYPNAPHAFHADYRPSYVEADARDGWEKALGWFRKHGVS
ncbi:dienelactone hydrolase family protein [Lacisediminimonas sp.]|uniref:dienelactone hydrolase family protein n=1 Tax=Lacisediminimonas sp. TaxID=3060582 RepID=UPI002724BC7B|nr:dienelactone hydrolase family protein [Lacisediminimonas sp.]MDO8299824.1 dienelactone hydrolase family protein [Lacisediminimonas sp.]